MFVHLYGRVGSASLHPLNQPLLKGSASTSSLLARRNLRGRSPGSTPQAEEPGASVHETVEEPDAAFVLGVQWHPEMTTDRRLFEALVTACRHHAHSRL